MSNPYYTHGSFPSTGAAATSASMRAELDLISAAFDKLPTLTSNANKFVVVNSTATGLTTTSTLPIASVNDSEFTFQDTADNTRKFQFAADAITPGATRLFTMPDADTTLVGTGTTQTLTNKTLTAPVIATIVNTGTLTLPTSTDTLVGRATTDTLTNKTLTNPTIGTILNTGTLTLPTSTDTLVGRATTDTLTNKTISGANNSLTNIGNSSLTNSAVTIGSSSLSLGGTLTTLAGVTISGASNTLSNIANASLTNSGVTFNGVTVALGASGTITASTTNALTIGTGLQLDTGTTFNGGAARTLSIDSTVATLSGSQTLSNKTISGSSNTLSNIANASLTNSSITIGSSSISLGSTASTISGLTSLSATGLIMTANAASSTAISAIAQSAGTVTVTAAGHGLTSGDLVSIDGVADYTYCGLVTVNVTNANVFTYSRTTTNASSSGGYVTKLQGTWASYSGGTGPSYKGGPLLINASSQLPALRVTQGGNGYALIVEDAANPDTSAFIIANDGSLSINTNKFTVDAATGNTVIAGTLTLAGGINLNGNVTIGDASSDTLTVNSTITSNLIFTDNTYDIGASGATRPRNLYLAGLLTMGGALTVNGNTTLGDAAADTLTVNSTITSNLIFTDNTYDIGASGATRPRNLYLAGLLTMGGALTVNGNTTLGDAAADTLTVNSTITSNLIFTDNTYDIGQNGATRPRYIYLSGGAYITNSGSGQLLGVTSNYAWNSGYYDIGALYVPNMTAGAVSLNLGKTSGTNNAGKIAFNYAGGSGSTNNYVELGLFNNDGLFKVFGTGNVAVPSGSLSVGTNSANAKLEVSIAAATSGEIARFTSPSYDSVYISAGASATSCGIGTLSSSAFNLFVNSSSKVTVLNSGGVGIGSTSVASGFLTQINGSLYLYKGNGAVKLDNTDGNSGTVQITGTDMRQGTDSNLPWWVYTNGNQRLYISATGNIGLAGAPTSWLWPDGSTSVLQTQAGAAFSGYNAGAVVSQNWYYNAGEKFIANGYASRYSQTTGLHIWSTSTTSNASGAGAALTWAEVARMDNDKNLLIGTTSSAGRLAVVGGATSTGYNLYLGQGGSYQDTAGYGNSDYGNGTWNWVPGTVPGSGAAQFYTRFRSRSGAGYSTTHNVMIDGVVLVADTTTAYSAQLYVNGAIAARNGGVDGTFQNAFVAGYTSNYTETNVIQSAVSSAASGSGFRFRVSNGGGSSGVTTVVDMVRNKVQTYVPISASGGSSGGSSITHSLTTSNVLYVSADSTSFTDTVILTNSGQATGANFYHLYGYRNANVNLAYWVRGDGTYGSATNTYGGTSDARLKTDIVDAGSQWEDVKAFRIRKYRMIDDPTNLVQLGVVSQELETTSPGLVEDTKLIGEVGGTVKTVKYSILYMKAVKALQEAMDRIEQLESRLTAANL